MSREYLKYLSWKVQLGFKWLVRNLYTFDRPARHTHITPLKKGFALLLSLLKFQSRQLQCATIQRHAVIESEATTAPDPPPHLKQHVFNGIDETGHLMVKLVPLKRTVDVPKRDQAGKDEGNDLANPT